MAMGYDETLRDFRTLVVDEEGLLDEVRSVAVDYVDVEVKRPWETYNKASMIRCFKKLDKVVLVLCPKSDGKEGKLAKDIEFVTPRERVEEVMRFWMNFRQGFLMEERELERVSRQLGRDYERFCLPGVMTRDKMLI